MDRYAKNHLVFEKAKRVIPLGIYGHQGPKEGCYEPFEAFPLFSEKAQGTYFWDLDGNRFIDYMAAYGPNLLGYNDPDVNEAAIRQMEKGDCVTCPSSVMVDLADLMVDTIAAADWAYFAKNGSDVTTLSIMVSRAFTGREKILMFKGCYHGASPLVQKNCVGGITVDETKNNIYIEWNNFDQLEEAFHTYGSQLAAVMAQPYMHGNNMDNLLPADGYWAKIRQLCSANGTVLVLDDIRAGFRIDVAGSDHYFGFEADLACHCKAFGNGFNISALTGKDFLKNTISRLAYTGSYWLSAVPMAASIACLEKIRRYNVPKVLNEKGTQLRDGLLAAAKKNGFNLHVTGMPSLFYLMIVNENVGDRLVTNEDTDIALHRRWIAECVQRGVFFVNHHNHFMNYAITDRDIQETIQIADEAFRAIR